MDAANDLQQRQQQVQQALEQLTTLNVKLMQTVQTNNLLLAQLLSGLADAVSRPRRLIEDAAGNPIGSEPAQTEDTNGQ
jgi:hypothetical protein